MANEKRLIDADALVDALTGITFSGWGKDVPYLNQWWNMAVKIKDNFIKAINNAPTVDAVEVVHGRWILLAEFCNGSVCTQCSVCGEEYTYKKGKFEFINAHYAEYNYCPNCGAKMDGDGNA